MSAGRLATQGTEKGAVDGKTKNEELVAGQQSAVSIHRVQLGAARRLSVLFASAPADNGG